ncbi:MAG: peptidoglycan DD-metalloendopeptidase family protein [Clostridia bacterium]|nr:peptidoglycan DD-metalloendopeptidase family protein [Clostridia bacterium]
MKKDRFLNRLATRFYRYHYGVGLHTVRLFRRVGRRLGRVLAPLTRRMRFVWKRRVTLPVHRFVRRMRQLGASFSGAFRELGGAAHKNALLTVPCFFRLCRRAVRRYWQELCAFGRLAGPIAAAAVLVITLVTWTHTDFCLTVTYRGEELGVIENAAVYDEGALLAKDRVINEDDSFTVDAVPHLSMTVRGDKVALSGAEVCDAILRTEGDSIAEATGLYVDGEFLGAMVSKRELQSVLNGVKEQYYDKNNKNQRAEFIQNVEMVDGLYPISTVKDSADLGGMLTAETTVKKTYTVKKGDTLSKIAQKNDMTVAQLRKLNPSYANTDVVKEGAELVIQRAQPFLRVKMVETIYYTETIDYKTQTVYNDKQYVTYEKVKTQGKEGSQDVVAEVTYMDGVESDRKVVSKTVTKQPVTKVVEKGTKKVTAQGGNNVVQGDGVATGNWTWPVPVCHNVYQGYHRGHLAIDISSGPVPVFNTPCLAATGGTVVYAGWYYGYGRYIKIDHGNGLYTTYAHLNSIGVVVGQKVSQGQQIGRIGNTGNSQGPHLHFEVIKNGVRVNPLNYVEP